MISAAVVPQSARSIAIALTSVALARTIADAFHPIPIASVAAAVGLEASAPWAAALAGPPWILASPSISPNFASLRSIQCAQTRVVTQPAMWPADFGAAGPAYASYINPHRHCRPSKPGSQSALPASDRLCTRSNTR
jgi:hypothetical protein